MYDSDDGGFFRRETQCELPATLEADICEYCSNEIIDDAVTSNDPNEGYLKFCSCDCLQDYHEDARVGRYEAAREREVWGNDYDSWYR
jgi:hypothetical protein